MRKTPSLIKKVPSSSEYLNELYLSRTTTKYPDRGFVSELAQNKDPDEGLRKGEKTVIYYRFGTVIDVNSQKSKIGHDLPEHLYILIKGVKEPDSLNDVELFRYQLEAGGSVKLRNAIRHELATFKRSLTPWLLATNRKLRHLQGISVRNLSFRKSHYISRFEPIDDECLPTTFSTPAKLSALRDSAHLTLEHSKSSTDLSRTLGQNASPKQSGASQLDGVASSRPSMPNMRRRSTHNWSNESSNVRQKKLEDVLDEKLSDVFVSISTVDNAEPVYITESVSRTMNPDFIFFDPRNLGAQVSRQSEVIVHVWAKTDSMEKHTHLIEIRLHLASLRWLGKSLVGFPQPLPPNSIIFHLVDGIYTCNTDPSIQKEQRWERLLLTSDVPLVSSRPGTPLAPKPRISTTQFTTSFDAIMRLKNLDDCIQDAAITQSDIIAKLKDAFDKQEPRRAAVNAAELEKQKLASAESAVQKCKRETDAVRKEIAKLVDKSKRREMLMEQGTSKNNGLEEQIKQAEIENRSLSANVHEVVDNSRGQLRRIASILSEIHPIEPIGDRSLAFTICGLYLPNADELSSPNRTTATEEVTAAALHHVAFVVDKLACDLEFAIPYPVTLYASRSTICDPITRFPSTKPSRIFPLFQAGSVQADFEYGVYLLNNNLVGLMETQKIRVVNPKNTLANLFTLFAILGSGPGDIPERKVGGIRALEMGVQKINVTGEIGGASATLAETSDGAMDGGTVINGIAKGDGKLKVGAIPTVKNLGPYTKFLEYENKGNGTARIGKS